MNLNRKNLNTKTPGERFRENLKNNSPLQILGTPNAYSAIMAKKLGAQAIYISGGALSVMSYGLPDLGIAGLEDFLIDTQRMTDAVDTPLIVDIDTGFGGMFNIERTILKMIKAGAAGVHIEDQVAQKRCGHRPNKQLVSIEEMCDRVSVAAQAKNQKDSSFFLIARTDAYASEGLESAITRAKAYLEAGADGIFAEALGSLSDYEKFCQAIKSPVLANITEFGKTPLFTLSELKSVGVSMILYPFAATRMMNAGAEKAYKVLLSQGTQKDLIKDMQTRETMYDYIGYHDYEDRLDQLGKK